MSTKTPTHEQTAAPAATREPEAIPLSHQDLGICTTCRHQARCLFFSAARQPIWQCEEFDDSPAVLAPGR
jgi:hypothetical protein